MALPIRLTIAGLAIVACAWFALGVRQVRELNAAGQLLDNPTTERVAAVQRRAASHLDAAGLLYPGIEVTLLRAQLAGNRHDYGQAKRLLDQATGAEPDNLATWLAHFHVQLGPLAAGSALVVVTQLRRLDPLAFPSGH